MSRTLAAIQLALQLVAPHFQPRAQAAVELRYLGEEFSIDPFTMIAVGERESGWDSRVVGKLGEVGIGQVMPSNFPSCRDDPNGDVCTGLRQYLHEWQFNLGMAMGLMSIQRDYCKAVVGSSLAIYWLQEYQGYAGTCGHRKDKRGRWRALPVPKGTLQVLARRRELARRFG